jgi:hypothetical protein
MITGSFFVYKTQFFYLRQLCFKVLRQILYACEKNCFRALNRERPTMHDLSLVLYISENILGEKFKLRSALIIICTILGANPIKEISLKRQCIMHNSGFKICKQISKLR